MVFKIYAVPNEDGTVSILDKIDGTRIQEIDIKGVHMKNIHGVIMPRKLALELGIEINDDQGYQG